MASVALLGDDAPGVSPELRVGVGDRVRLGQTLWVDRQRPALRFTAPGAGIVSAVERGARRRLQAVVIRLEGDGAERFDALQPTAPGDLSREPLQALMLASGLWTALRTRPFSLIPDPGSAPRSIFVTAMESEPGAPRAERIIAESAEDFARGVAALTHLTDGRVQVCSTPGAELVLPDHERVVWVEFDGPHPSGLPGTHIHCLDPVGPGRQVWHLGYSDAIALGQLLATGQVPDERIVALSGPAMTRPRLVRTRRGASLQDLLAPELRRKDCRVVSGSVLTGRRAIGWSGYLGALHTQVCALPESDGTRPWDWLAVGGRGRPRRLLAGRGSRAICDTSLGGERGAFLPLERFDRVFPFDLLVAPLLRALLVGNVDAALRLGCLELAEEDLALLAFLCPGKLEYGPLLRAVLDEIVRGLR